MILEYALGAATVSIGWSGYLVNLLDNFGLHIPTALTAADGTTPGVHTIFNLPAFLIIILITWILSMGINQTKRVNDIMVLIKLAVVILFIVCTVWFIKTANLHPFVPYGLYSIHDGTAAGIIPAASIVFFSFIGFDAVSSSAEETINPSKTLPRGILLSLLISTILYIMMTLIMTGVVKYTVYSEYLNAPILAVLVKTGQSWLSMIVSLGAILGMTTVLLVMLYGQSRISYSMARDGLFPKVFSKVDAKRKTPFVVTWFFGIVTALAGGFINLNILARTSKYWYFISLYPRISRNFSNEIHTTQSKTGLQNSIGSFHTNHGNSLLFSSNRWIELGNMVTVPRLVNPRDGILLYLRSETFRFK